MAQEAAAQQVSPRRHVLSREHTHNRWNRDLPPVLSARSGDEIEFHTAAADDGQIDPDQPSLQIDGTRVHPLTGPVFVEDAEPGDVLEVQILRVETGDWGWHMITRERGFVKHFIDHPQVVVARIDRERGVIRYPSGAELPLSPFPGIVGVAPPEPGEFRTIPPGKHGGNIDVKELTAGSTLYLPVWVPGALLSVGDVHAGQGDGEVCLNGVETEGRVTVRIVLHKGKGFDRPQLKTATHYGLLSVGESADEALQDALRAGILFLEREGGIPREEAYAVCSGGADLRINQLVNNIPSPAIGARIMFPLQLLASLGIEPDP